MEWPTLRDNSGSFLLPNSSSTITKIMISCGVPRSKNAKLFITLPFNYFCPHIKA